MQRKESKEYSNAKQKQMLSKVKVNSETRFLQTLKTYVIHSNHFSNHKF